MRLLRIGSVMLALLFSMTAMTARADKIRDIATFAGVRPNQLIGYGLVVGLDGSGDQTTQTPFTVQSVTNMLNNLGVQVPSGGNLQLKNVAAVTVTAALPAFARPGQPLDITVSSIGNAKSLRGGTLVMTPLKGVDNQIYAMAQGNVLVAGAGASAGGSSTTINQLATGRIPGGATVERAVPGGVGQGDFVQLELLETNFTVANHVVTAINSAFGPVASAMDGRVIQIRAPEDTNQRVTFFEQAGNAGCHPGRCCRPRDHQRAHRFGGDEPGGDGGPMRNFARQSDRDHQRHQHRGTTAAAVGRPHRTQYQCGYPD